MSRSIIFFSKTILTTRIKEQARYDAQLAEMAAADPFFAAISDLEDTRRTLKDIDPAKAAATLNELAKQVSDRKGRMRDPATPLSRNGRSRIGRRGQWTACGAPWGTWYTFYRHIRSAFYVVVRIAVTNRRTRRLRNIQTFITEKLVGIRPDDKTTIIGDPIGREALIEELKYEMIPYTPEELIEIANKEFAWCEAEMKKASREMGYGDDWKKALEAVKQKYVEPGKQPALIRDLAYQAIDFVEKNDLVTVPKLARDGWRMEMMTPERQLVAPFFLGGETILVSYPTDGMTHEQKMMSMRGNNPHFSHATVFHELIPGPSSAGIYEPSVTGRIAAISGRLSRSRAGRCTGNFCCGTRVSTRRRRTVSERCSGGCTAVPGSFFQLNFHLEKMTPQECVDFLVDRVGHERDNAAAEVRRSFAGDYGPLYQIAYMMGGLQFYNLHHDLVDGKK